MFRTHTPAQVNKQAQTTNFYNLSKGKMKRFKPQCTISISSSQNPKLSKRIKSQSVQIWTNEETLKTERERGRNLTAQKMTKTTPEITGSFVTTSKGSQQKKNATVYW